MRFLPRSLFGRMVLILLGGLILAQMLSAIVLLHDRENYWFRASAAQSAGYIADIVKLLDSAAPAERQRIVDILNSPSVAIALRAAPAAPSRAAPEEEGHAAVFVELLQEFLGSPRPVKFVITGSLPANPFGAYRFERKGGLAERGSAAAVDYFPAGRYAFVAQIRLRDGMWVSFDHPLPKGSLVWTYRLLLKLLFWLMVVIVVALAAVRLLTRPLHTLARAAEELGRDINRPPLAEEGSAEVRQAARAFNTMQERLVRFIRDRTRILAAMSHDLKTPITRLRLRVELLDDPELTGKFGKDLQEMEHMVAETLNFMRGLDSEEAAQPVDVMALLESIQADLAEISRDVRIGGKVQKPLPARPLALRRCLTNLIDNALKYGVRAEIAVEETRTWLRIRVADEGPGIPAAELERVFDPYYRLEESRSRDTGGTGLGLSIARNIARAHGGDIVLRNRALGGLEAVVTLPY